MQQQRSRKLKDAIILNKTLTETTGASGMKGELTSGDLNFR